MKPYPLLLAALLAVSAIHADASDTKYPLGAQLRVRTRATDCQTATKCYLDSHEPAVASGGPGDLDAPFSVSTSGSHHVSCNSWDASGNVYVSPSTNFTVIDCGAPAILSPVPSEVVCLRPPWKICAVRY